MARVFISCNTGDSRIGMRLQQALEGRGHEMTLAVDAKPAGRWETQLLKGLRDADAVVSLLTPRGLKSNWVVGQTGQAIAYEYRDRMLLLPVLAPDADVPNFVAAFHCFWLEDRSDEAIERLAGDLDQALQEHAARQPPRVFISHRHGDREIATAVIALLEAAFDIQKSDIRCTSVAGYKLPAGSQSADSLQRDLNGAEVVLGLIGPETAKSDYVLFELGASWGLGTPTFPLRVSGASYENVPEVLRERSSLALEDVSQCLQLVADVARVCSFPRRVDPQGGDEPEAVRERARALADVAKKRPAKG